MEKQLFKVKLIFLVFSLIFTSNLFAQSNSSQPQMSSYTQTGKIRVQLWSLLEQEPKLLQEKNENQSSITQNSINDDFFYAYSVEEIKSLAPFVFEGIIHGWNFSYTPYDKTRNVNEYFDFSVNGPNISKNDKNISYKDPYFQDNKLFCWAEYQLSKEMVNKLKQTKSILFKKISGKGKGKVSEGEEGIKSICRSSKKRS